ncbi:MAG: hypothetical protein SFW07_07725 [Gammaproteobacteria bacterium]|nr:hypothetical protein [Gammaproteobacteria bacterium]
MMSKIQVVPGKTPIPPDSIIFTSCKSFEKLAAPDAQPEEIATLAALFKVAIDTRSAARQLPLSVSEKHINELEFIHYWTLLLFTHYLTLNAQHQPDAQRIQLWMEKYEFIQRYIENYERKYITEHLAFYKISTLLCAIKSHVDILSGKKTSAVLLSVYHFACTLQEYRNYAAILARTKGFQESILTQEASPLFYDDQRNAPFNGWCKVVTQVINRTIGHIMTHEEYSDHEVKFLEYTVGCLSEKKPVNPNFPRHIEQFDFPGFQKSILAEGISKLLSTNKNTDNTVLAQSLVFAQIKFLRTQFLHPEMSHFFGATIAADTFLRNAMPFLFIYLYFTPCFDLNFLATQHAAGYTDITEDGRIMLFLQRIGAAVEPFHFEKLVELTNTFENNAVRHMLIYLLLDRAQENTLLQQALRKLKIHKFTEPLLKQSVETLEYIFGPRSQDAKIQSIKNYLILAEKKLDHWKTLSFSISLLLICKKALELESPTLTSRVKSVLDGFQSVVMGKPISIQAASSDTSVREILQALKPAVKSKPSKKKKTKKKKKSAPKTQITATAEILEETVTVESFKAVEITPASEPRAPSPVSSNASDEERETTLSLMDYLERAKWLPAEEIQSVCPPVERLMNVFNPLATEDNNFRFASFLMGGALRDILSKKIPRDWDINIIASEKEIRELLEKHRTELKIETLSFVEGGHPHFFLTFSDTPGIVLEVSPLENTTPRSLHRFIKKRQASLDYDVNSLFYTQLNGRKYLYDSQGALAALKARKLNRISCEAQTETRMTTIMIRGALLLKRLPELEPVAELLAWYDANKTLLASNPAAKRTFVKLLYSDRANEALAAMAQLGFLEQLFPELVSIFDKPHFKTWVEEFTRKAGPRLLEKAKISQHDFENVHDEVVIAYTKAAEKKPVLKTDFTFVPQMQQTPLMYKPREEDTQKNPCYTSVTSTQGTITWTMQPK